MWKEILEFWFNELEPKMWWVKDEVLDSRIRGRFMELHTQAMRGELYSWRAGARSSLAEIIVLDQFSRNMFRDTPQAFASDPLALALAQNAIEKGFDKELEKEQRSFMYIPFMHSESAMIHGWALELYTALGMEDKLKYEKLHKAIIDRFGRYPHRNAILGRQSTQEELEFLKEPHSSF